MQQPNAPRTLGIVGAGQLARMMVPAALELGIRPRVLAEAPGMSAEIAATQVGDYRDLDTVRAFAKTVDAITFDHEHVPQSVLTALVEAGVAVHPGPEALLFAQDKLRMRQRIAELELPGPDFAEVRSADDVDAFVHAHGGVAVLKTARGGYDGKGVAIVRSGEDAAEFIAHAAETGVPLVVEEKVPFVRELAQLVARRPSGELRSYPLAETVQRDGVCAEVMVPAPSTSAETAEVARDIAETIARELGVTGILAVELFETADGRVLVNELAMRPHNSGHFSQDAAVTSQFENHVRAVLDLPLGDTALTAPAAVMVNVLGGPRGEAMPDRYARVLAEHPRAKVHSYDKASRPGRKVGHVNVAGEDASAVLAEARAAAALFA